MKTLLVCITSVLLSGCLTFNEVIPRSMIDAAFAGPATRTSCTGSGCFTMDRKGNILNETKYYSGSTKWRK